MSKPTALGSVSSFTDLPELYDSLTATTPFEASFGDPIPLSIAGPQEEPAEHLMPEAIAAQAECGGVCSATSPVIGQRH